MDPPLLFDQPLCEATEFRRLKKTKYSSSDNDKSKLINMCLKLYST
jgi:hypothetical protein